MPAVCRWIIHPILADGRLELGKDDEGGHYYAVVALLRVPFQCLQLTAKSNRKPLVVLRSLVQKIESECKKIAPDSRHEMLIEPRLAQHLNEIYAAPQPMARPAQAVN